MVQMQTDRVKRLGEALQRACERSTFWRTVEWLLATFPARFPAVKFYVVGGTIRDFILDTSNMIVDLDLMVEGIPSDQELHAALLTGGRITPNMMGGGKWHPDFAVSGVREEMDLDIWRIENGVCEGDEPTIALGVSRFDLNINSIAWDLAERRFINPLGGLEILLDPDRSKPMDLLTEKIKPGNDGRLILRAIKYGAKLGFPLGAPTYAWVRAHEAALDALPDEKIPYVFRSIEIVSIRPEVEKLTRSLLSPARAARVLGLLY